MSNDRLDALLNVMKKLRDPVQGCVWDKQQTYKTIVPHTLEEAYEVVEAIENEDFEALPSELGDLLFQIVFYSQIAKEEGRFDFYDVCQAITDKMIRRHPHVFSDLAVETVEEQKRLWEKIKAKERSGSELSVGALDNVRLFSPSLSVATNLQKQAANVGFDWPDIQGPLAKVEEELEEVKAAIEQGTEAQIKDEIGDLIFSSVNIARHMKIDPDAALRDANRKFTQRFKGMEAMCKADGRVFSELTLKEMENYWLFVK